MLLGFSLGLRPYCAAGRLGAASRGAAFRLAPAAAGALLAIRWE